MYKRKKKKGGKKDVVLSSQGWLAFIVFLFCFFYSKWSVALVLGHPHELFSVWRTVLSVFSDQMKHQILCAMLSPKRNDSKLE